VSTERTKRCSLDLAASRTATVTARPAASAGLCIESPPSITVTINAISVVKPGSSSRPRQYAATVRMMTPKVAMASSISPPTMKLMAPASEVIVNVRSPAGERDGPSPLRRSRSAPINKPIPSATAMFRITGSKMSMSSGYAALALVLVLQPEYSVTRRRMGIGPLRSLENRRAARVK